MNMIMIGRVLMLRLHYVPGGHGSPVCPKRSAPWNLDQFYLWIQVLLRLAKFVSRSTTVSVTGRGGKGMLSPGGSKAHYGSARVLPRMPERSLPVRHVLMGSLTFLTFWSRSDTFFTFRQGFVTDETWTQGSLGARLCRRYKKKVSQAIAIMVSWDLALCQTVVERNAP